MEFGLKNQHLFEDLFGFAEERPLEIQIEASSLWYLTLGLSFLFPTSSVVDFTLGLGNASNLYLCSLEHISFEAAPCYQLPQLKLQELSSFSFMN